MILGRAGRRTIAIGSSLINRCPTCEIGLARTADAFIVQDCLPSDCQLM